MQYNSTPEKIEQAEASLTTDGPVLLEKVAQEEATPVISDALSTSPEKAEAMAVENAMLYDLLEQCRSNLGPAPRSFSLQRRYYHSVTYPSWVSRDDLKKIYGQRANLLAHGQIVWAHVMQANFAAFHPGPHDLPGLVIYSLDPAIDKTPSKLGEAARAIWKLKGKRGLDSSLVEISALVTDEMKRPFAARVPESLTDGISMMLTSVMVMRKHTAFGFLSSELLPLLTLPFSKTEATLILPSIYWPQELIDR